MSRMEEDARQGQTDTSRRDMLKGVAGGAAALAVAGMGGAAAQETKKDQPKKEDTPLKGRIKQSVCKWCFGKIPMAEFAPAVAKLGIKGVEMVGPGDWPVLKQNGLVCAMVSTHGIGKGFNRKENHDECVAAIRKWIEAAAENGFPNVIAFSGNRGGLSDEDGAKACVEGLKKIAGFAEEKKVTICLELLNSKRDHKDYQCDHTAWGVDVCKKVGSPRVKLLYDIYHMQIQEGDVIATIRDGIEYIGHFHTAGVPGRNEIDDTQELYYPAIMRAIAEAIEKGKFDGFVGQEFIAKRDAMKSLAEAVRICDV